MEEICLICLPRPCTCQACTVLCNHISVAKVACVADGEVCGMYGPKLIHVKGL